MIPDDVERLILPVLGHRVIFTPSSLIELRRLSPAEAAARFRGTLLEAAPRPEPEWEPDVNSVAARSR